LTAGDRRATEFPDFAPLYPRLLALLTTGNTAGMLVSPSRLGGIEEIESSLRWDAAALSTEIGRRAAHLSRLGIARASRVAIARGGQRGFLRRPARDL
jgi:hypothetical protein